MKPVSVTIINSNNPCFFERNKEFDFDHFERMALTASLTNQASTGKTVIRVKFDAEDTLFDALLELNPQSTTPDFRSYCKEVTKNMQAVIHKAGEVPTEKTENAAGLLQFLTSIEFNPVIYRHIEKSPVT